MEYYVWLQLAFAARTAKLLLDRYGTAENVYEAYISGKLRLSVREQNKAESVKDDACNKIVNTCKKNGIAIIPLGHNDYPYLLSQIPDAPTIIYAVGDVSFLNEVPCICIVGPRDATNSGNKAAFSLSARLAACGFSVVSGIADGVDTAAHLGAAAIGVRSALVLPCGHLHEYRKDKDSIKRRVLKNGGCILSEYPPFYEDGADRFRPRNRIMAGLSLGVVIPEAGERSGSLMTAGSAGEYGRDVFVVPSPFNDENHIGSNALLSDGATELHNALEIVREYINQYDNIDPSVAFTKEANEIILRAYDKAKNEFVSMRSNRIKKKIKQDQNVVPVRQLKPISELSDDAKAVYRAINDDLFLTDYLDITDDELENGIFLALFELERAGYIESAPSGFYRRIV